MGRRIVFAATGLGRGGAETQLVRIATGLAARGWEPHVVSLIDRDMFSEELAAHGIATTFLGMERGRPDPRGAARLYRLLRQLRPDVFVSFLVAANTIGRPVARAARVPVVISSIRTPVLHNAKREWMLRLTAPFHDALVFNSQTVADDAILRGLIDPSDAHVIRNGLDLSAFGAGDRADVRAEWGASDDDFVWFTAGHLRPEKNYPALLRAFRSLRAAHPRVRLVAAGGFFQDHAPVLAEFGDLLDSGAVTLLGNRTDVPRLLNGADAFVLASIYDASPNGLIEALASRLPCVATRVGGVPEIITGPDVGVLAPTSDADDLLRSMDALMRLTQAQRRQLGEAGRAHVEVRFGLDRLVDEWEDLIATLAFGQPVREAAR